MPKIYRPRKIGTIDYASAQRKTLELDRDGVLMRVNVRVQFTITNSGVAPTDPLFQTLARIIRRIEFIIGGRDTVVAISGEMAAVRATHEFGAVPDGMEDTVVLTVAAATVYDITIPIPFFLPRARRPDDTGIDLRRVTQATVALTWANSDASDIYGTSNGAVISAVTCTIEGEYLLDADPTRFVGVRQLAEIEKDLAATNSTFSMTIDGRTGLVVRDLMVASLVAKVGSNAILSAGSLKVESGPFVFLHRDGPMIRAANKSDGNLESLIAGVYHVPLILFGELNQGINTSPDVLPADLDVVLDATKQVDTNTLLMSVESVRPPKF